MKLQYWWLMTTILYEIRLHFSFFDLLEFVAPLFFAEIFMMANPLCYSAVKLASLSHGMAIMGRHAGMVENDDGNHRPRGSLSCFVGMIF